MPGQISWNSIFHPNWEPGGLSAAVRSITSRLLDDFDSYASNAALQAVWSISGGGGGDAVLLSSAANALKGQQSLEVTLTGGPAVVSREFNRNLFHFAAGGEIRYVVFRGIVTSAGAPSTIRVRIGNTGDTIYKEWSFILDSSVTREMFFDLYSGGAGYQNTESNPAPIATLGTWDPAVVSKISFRNLENGKVYRLDDIRFAYDGGNSSLLDLIGFGTEPPIAIGTSGSLNARLNSIHADVKGLEGQTLQYAKQGIGSAEIGQALQWGLELNSEFAPPTTTEIDPGNYTIDRIRLGVTTNIVASTPASESAGTIFASYTPPEADWNVGDLVKVTFSGGFIRTDELPSVSLTANTLAGATTVTVANAAAFQVGWLVKILDDDSAAEWHTISSIDSPTTFTIDAVVGNFTTLQNATIRRAVRTDLSTAIFFTMLQTAAQSFKILATGTFTTSSATVPADTGRTESNDYWNGSWLMPITGAIVNQPRLIVDFANAGGIFTLDAQQPFTAVPGLVEYIIIGPNSQLAPAADATTNTTPAHVAGNKTDAIPAMNLAPGSDSIVAHAKAILERIGSTPADPDDSVLTNLGQRDDTATLDDLSDVTTTSIEAKLRRILLRFSADAFSSTIQGVARTDIENMLSALATYISAAGAAWSVTANPGGTAKDNLEQTLEDFADILAGTAGIVTFPVRAVAADGVSVAEVLRHAAESIGENTANNAFDSSSVIANSDGSVLERMEDISLTLNRATYQLADYDDFDVADADANNERWNTGYINGAEGGSADINTTTAGKLMVKVDPDVTPTAAGYAVNLSQPMVSKYFSTTVDVNSTFGTPSASWATTGIRVSPSTYDSNNVVYLQRQNSSGGVLNRLAAGAVFGGANQGEVYFTTSDAALAFKIERWDNVWRLFYSLTQYPDYSWTLLTQYEDASENMDSQQSIYLDSYSPGSADAETSQGDFDNFKLYISVNGISQEVSGDYDSSVVVADEDGSIAERLEQVQEAVNRGTGTSIAANKSLVDALGSDGTTVTDSAVSVLGAVGADNANNAFASTNVVANRDGSVLERQEYLIGEVEDNADSVENRIGNLTARANDGSAVTALGLDNLPDVASGDLYNLLWKYLTNTAIAAPTTKTGLQHLQAIGSDDANNDFASTSIAENGDGSVLERLEELRGRTDTTGSPFTLTAAMGTAEQTVVNYTPTKNGRIAALFDLQTLVDDAYVGTITVRLKFMADGVNLREFDRADFLVGTDSTMPTIAGYVVEGASFVRLTIQANVAVDDVPAKTIPFRIIES